jgi:hypothetical protein
MHKSDSDASAHSHVHTLTRARVPSPTPRTKTCNPNVCTDGAWTVYGCQIHAHTCTHSHERGYCRPQHALKPAIPTCAQMAPGLWVGVTKVSEYPSFPTTQVAMRWSESDGLLTIATSRDSVQPLVVAEQGTICTRSTNAFLVLEFLSCHSNYLTRAFTQRNRTEISSRNIATPGLTLTTRISRSSTRARPTELRLAVAAGHTRLWQEHSDAWADLTSFVQIDTQNQQLRRVVNASLGSLFGAVLGDADFLQVIRDVNIITPWKYYFGNRV